MTRVRFPLTVFYDASCPLCANEMHALKARDGGGKLELVDCSAPDFDESVLAGVPIRRTDLMTVIHARDAGGRWLRGIDVFEAAYGAAGLDAAARLWKHPRLRPLWERIYPWIARHRPLLSRLGAAAAMARAMSYCRDSQCSSRTRATTVKRESPSGRTTANSPSAR
jgi:predicted DCC family thiol-disulfide oxidoreductase YuxK